MPEFPPPGDPVLVRVAVSPSRAAARREIRLVLREVLAAGAGAGTGCLEEKPQRGPVVRGEPVDISLSYGCRRGVDRVDSRRTDWRRRDGVEPFAEVRRTWRAINSPRKLGGAGSGWPLTRRWHLRRRGRRGKRR